MKASRYDTKKTDVAIIGAGAAGLVAGITAARNHASVMLLDKNDKVGRKLLSTGNGRCNFTNACQTSDCYHSCRPEMVKQILKGFSVFDILAFFEEIGIFPTQRNGYYYPYTNAAKDVRDCLSDEADRLGITKCCQIQVERIEFAAGKGFLIHCVGKESFLLEAGKCILATGGLAFPKSGSTGDGYRFARHFGHYIEKTHPALVELFCKESFFRSLKGIRLTASVCIYADNRIQAKDQGDVQLTATGISGIPVFNVSLAAIRAIDEGKTVFAALNLLPMLDNAETTALLKKRFWEHGDKKTSAEALRGLFVPALIRVLLKMCHFKDNRPASSLSLSDLKRLAHTIQDFRVTVDGHGTYEKAQTTAGGVSLSDINPLSMESTKQSGLFFCGELLDVDGICGGYNLTFAWTSGYLAGRAAAVSCKKSGTVRVAQGGTNRTRNTKQK